MNVPRLSLFIRYSSARRYLLAIWVSTLTPHSMKNVNRPNTLTGHGALGLVDPFNNPYPAPKFEMPARTDS